MTIVPFLRLCLVTDRDLAGGRALVDIVAAAIAGGVTMVQLREKTGTTRGFLEEARALRTLLRPLGVPLIINDRADIALAVDADGVHVGQKDMPVEQLREMLGPNKIIGLSVTNRQQVEAADAYLANYLGIGPLFVQTTKADASSPLGVDGFAALRRLTDRPVIAIGGLKHDNSRAVLDAGADGLAVVSAIIANSDPKAAAARFQQLWP